ncbi:glucose 1-dehydrogenase [soil metagenome]
MGNLEGRVALVTGGLGGIGLAIAERYVAEGATLWVTDIAREGTPPVLSALGRLGNQLRYFPLDVTDEREWRAAEQRLRDEGQGLDILVLNAGVAGGGATAEVDLAEWRRIMAVNADGAFLGIRAMSNLLAESGAGRRGGSSIIVLSSILGLVGYAETAAYSASKGAVRLLAKATAVEFATARRPIRVNSIHPGFIRTEMALGEARGRETAGESGALDDLVATLESKTPMGRLGEPEEVAGVAAFLASEDSSFMTGSEMIVDGGWTAW